MGGRARVGGPVIVTAIAAVIVIEIAPQIVAIIVTVTSADKCHRCLVISLDRYVSNSFYGTIYRTIPSLHQH